MKNYRVSLNATIRPSLEDVINHVCFGGLKTYNMKSEKEYTYFPIASGFAVEIINLENNELKADVKRFPSVEEVQYFLENDGTDSDDLIKTTGKYYVNGKLIIVKNNKKYTANGILIN